MSDLAERLRSRIAATGPITFADFMEAALYDPAGGFYARGARLGQGGAFMTAPAALDLFASALGSELRRLWEALERPRPLTVVEIGGGDGTLAAALAQELADLPLDLVLCDRAGGMAAQATAKVPRARAVDLDALAPVTGAIVANEVHDACPAHRLRWPHELLVEVAPDRRFRLTRGPLADERLTHPLRQAGVEPVTGAEYEVAPAQAELQTRLARVLERGELWMLDYGEAGRERYTRPIPRLRTYLAGRPGGDPLAAPGTQDITVDVDLGAVRAAGESAGLETVLDVDQAAWLRSHGALAAAAALPQGSAGRLWLQSLAAVGSTGESFRVLVQARGVRDRPRASP